MSTKKKKPTIKAQEHLSDGSVRLVFDRPHGAFRAGMGLMLSNGPHVVERVVNKMALTVRAVEVAQPAPADPPLRARAALALRVLVGNRGGLRRLLPRARDAKA